ncbi:hypothetical protein FB451DRAFT_1560940 [Mycena latifolia]|nr:hypothetical protein FB451DRAFT_1560940 [Mycena latifolia]
MDPITATTTIITLATFIKDLIDVGHSIKRSIEKVRENRRRIRDLTDDILSTLAKLADLSRANEDTFQTPAQLSALGDLKADMLHTLSICSTISPARPSPGFRGFGSQIKGWMKRDDVEAEIRRLKQHVNKCYLQFTAFSAARIEQQTSRIEGMTHRTENTALRVEHALLVNNVENQVSLRRVEGLMARVLLETQFGQNVMNQTIEIMASDTAHQTLEFQYLSAQALRLVDSLQQLSTSSVVILDTPPLDVTTLVYVKSVSPEHVLYQILGVMLRISGIGAEIPFTSIEGIIRLGANLDHLGMSSEAMAWELLTIKILRRLTHGGGVLNSGVLSNLAHATRELSNIYQGQLRWDLATETSQQAMDLCRLWKDISPDVDYRPLLAAILFTHSQNLYHTAGHSPEVVIPIAEEAVAVSRAMVGKLIESGVGLSATGWTEEDEYKVLTTFRTSFSLSRALSSAGRHLEAYEASRNGFCTILQFSRPQFPIAAMDIDTFIDQICKVEEGGGFSLAMLADSVVLFRDLSRIYMEEFSAQFLRLLYAYAYLSQQHSLDVGSLRVFLEPEGGHPLPILDISEDAVYINDFNPYGGVIKDIVRACCHLKWNTQNVSPILQSIFIAHFDQAIIILHEVTSKLIKDPNLDSSLEWLLRNLSDELFPVVTRSQQLVLLGIMTTIVAHFRTVYITSSPQTTRGLTVFTDLLWDFSWGLWMLGLLDDAKKICDESLEYLRRLSSGPYDDTNDHLLAWLVFQSFVLSDMAQIPDAIDATQGTETVFRKATKDLAVGQLRYCGIRVRILQRTRRDREAIQLLRWVVTDSEVGRLSREDNMDVRCFCYLLLADLATTRKHVGQFEKALKDAERAVAASRKSVGDDHGKHSLVHSLTTLSNCLATVGRNNDALAAAEEATSLYSSSAPHMWRDYLYSLRRQELGGNAFHSLSLRLAAAGKIDESLLSAEKATHLYRELVLLAPRHLPTLANSLQNFASILRKIERVDESVSACEEAISILRQVAETETYFLPALAEALDQLAGYFAESGDTERASAVISESTDVRRRIGLLPTQTGLLFPDIDMDSKDEDEDDAWETATESEEEYQDAPGAPTDMEVVVLEASSSLPSIQQMVSSAETPLEQSRKNAREPEGPAAMNTAKPVQTRVANMLSTLLEIRLSSMPVDILLWMLVGILSVAVALLWSRVQ